MQAIKVLVVASKDLQKEIVESGRVSGAVVSALSLPTCAAIWFALGSNCTPSRGICHF